MALAFLDPDGWEPVGEFGMRVSWKRQDGRTMVAVWFPKKGLRITVHVTPQEAIRGLKEVVETFQCNMQEACAIVRARR